MKRSLLILVLMLAGGLPAGAEEMLSMDERLSQTISVHEQGDRLSEVLRRLSKATSVTLDPCRPIQNVPVVIQYKGSLKGLMSALGSFFSVGKNNPASWRKSDTNPPVYTLQRDENALAALNTLRKERQSELARGVDQAIRDEHPWVKHLAFLTEKERAVLYAGGSITHDSDYFGGEEYLQTSLPHDREVWAERVMVTHQMTGRSPLARMFVRAFEDDRNRSAECFAVAQMCPQFAPETQQMEWRQRYGDPATTGGKEFFTRSTVAEPGQLVSRRHHLLVIAQTSGINLIADDSGQWLDESRQPAKGTVAQLLDAACSFQWGGGDTPETNHGSFWREITVGENTVIVVRSLAWIEEEG